MVELYTLGMFFSISGIDMQERGSVDLRGLHGYCHACQVLTLDFT